LDDIEDLLLDQAGFVADTNYQVSLCHSHCGFGEIRPLSY
jgi:hypothetical protein